MATSYKDKDKFVSDVLEWYQKATDGSQRFIIWDYTLHAFWFDMDMQIFMQKHNPQPRTERGVLEHMRDFYHDLTNKKWWTK